MSQPLAEASAALPSEALAKQPPSPAPGGFPSAPSLYPWALPASVSLALAFALAVALSFTGIAEGPALKWTWLDALTNDGLFSASLLGAFVFAITRLSGARPRVGSLFTGALLFAGLFALLPPTRPIEIAYRAFAALGMSGLAFSAHRISRVDREERRASLDELLAVVSFVGAIALLPFLSLLTTAFRPLVLDPHALRLDGSLGFQPLSALGHLFAKLSWLEPLFATLYMATPAAILAIHFLAPRSEPNRGSLLLTTIALALLGGLFHHLAPIAGPLQAYPRFPLLPEGVDPGSILLDPAPRHGLPALPFAFAVALYWHSRALGRRLHALGIAWLALTLFASLGLGLHYAIALVATIPFTLGVMTLVTPRAPSLLGFRATVFAISSALFAIIIVGLHLRVTFLAPLPPLVMALAVALPWELTRRYTKRAEALAEAEEPTSEDALDEDRDLGLAWAMGVMFFISGAAGLIYEVVFAKSLALTFGSTTRASTTVLATYMGGMALGAFLGGRIARGKTRPLIVYAICEAGIALWCALSPFMLGIVQKIYVGLASGADASAPWLGGLQVALGALLLLPPTILMGLTLPVVAKQFEKRMALGRAIGLLYGANTFGAALASLSTGYFILPFLGISRTTWFAVLANFGAAALAILVDKRLRKDIELEADSEDRPAPKAIANLPAFEPKAAALVLGVGGVITLALEVVYIHLLAIVAGNSAYAFSLMLFAFLLGLGGGAAIGRKMLERRRLALRYLGWMQLGLAACVLLGVFGWEAVPNYFASFEEYAHTRGFGARELVRAAICCMMMIPPALFIGAAYPLAMACRVEGAPDPIRATGRASALNTVGNVTGAFVGSFVLVPYLGALRSLQLLALLAFALGLLATLGTGARLERWKASAPALIVVVLLAVQPSVFNLNRLASGTNVYFERQGYGKVVDHAESADGGLTMVTESFDPGGRRVLTLLTNGKFQGDDSQSREMAAQFGFALFPLLHTTARDKALVIGFGTGVSARAVDDAGFSHTDIIDLSEDIFTLADKHFQSVNGGVLSRPRARAHVTDGRNFLLLSEERYDLIGMEISSIWFAGAASLYNREFYQLVKSRLADDGILQQWVQLHRLSPRDLASIFASLQAEFERVWLYFGGGQGILVACNHDCEPTDEAILLMDRTPSLEFALSTYGGKAKNLLRSKLLDTSEITAFIDSLGIPTSELISTDDNLFLEYSTPRGNVRPYRASIQQNVRMLSGFRGN